MIDEKTVFRMLRYFAILTYEHYQTKTYIAERFNLPLPHQFTLEECLRNICKDFGLSYDIVKEHSDLEDHN